MGHIIPDVNDLQQAYKLKTADIVSDKEHILLDQQRLIKLGVGR